ncbi:CPBP family intramembrane glutamic endopeptidase [Microcoleus sp. OTE_8_concoct_300]|uniref:CPBP family intramembrane glutamic endopeptidase n=1 Tax=Microcoleus sp. OTE_8_concoct_300 TaxID=2964710 RepID=UPI00403F53E7
MDNSLLENKSPLKFFLLVLLLSIPFWILGAMAGDLTKILPIKLPISALTTFCPLLAATILVYKQREMQGVKELLKLSFDFKKIKNKKWYIPIVFVMPVIAVLSYWYMKMTGATLPEPQTPLLFAFISFFIFLIAAIGEEVGWSGYAIDPMQNKWGALKASIILGLVWAIWHIIPYSQAHHTPIWIVWQCISTVFLRVIIVWIYNNTVKSVFATILFHAMINVSTFMFPNYGSHYNPFVGAIFIIMTVVIVVFFWGTKTLARYRYT